MAGRRSEIKIETKESRALKRMRLVRGLSLVKAARVSRIEYSMLNHAENGRLNITEDYIERFLTGFNFTREEWELFVDSKVTVFDKRDECIKILGNLSKEKVEIVYALLVNLK
ncbi:MAG: helix-turn-helix transcriptional regulator [Oligoflexia bacterium]|nr:helix-turn-helix transcriptional regulator [Oligoflexia bacterium]